ncbi:putative immunoglobulin-blocking virulence protein [Mycoplasmopsis synoviae]|uniref:Immunoglobulin-blocking virulence protein n=2 Tax=Mycoplasmopsis synoviae TaxID=2109 RepID=A0AAX3F157_MYCSY|nr:putative immunoglobulin-blocking virulence protein [Mycoplasmopsis synoviae]UZW63840.1 putative immunoglobulin-blocking virulence protein [Mycoplasmopsis synoviae]UZW64549.1 putative immunoglobulin-blocking virulence protein [Mycoplasmopsis synoviae]
MNKIKKKKLIILFGFSSAILTSAVGISFGVTQLSQAYNSNQQIIAINRSRSFNLITAKAIKNSTEFNTDLNLEELKEEDKVPIQEIEEVPKPIEEVKKEEPPKVVAPKVELPQPENPPLLSSAGSIVDLNSIKPTVSEKSDWNKPTGQRLSAALQQQAREAIGKAQKAFNDVFSKLKVNPDGTAEFTKAQKEELADSLGVPADKTEWFFKMFLKNFEEGNQITDMYGMLRRDPSTAKTNREMFLHAINNVDFDFYFSINNIPYIKWEYGNDITIGGRPPSDAENVVVQHQINLNKKRFLSSDSKWRRYSPQMIADNDYFGWTQTDITSEVTSRVTLPSTDGIKISKYVANSDNAVATDKTTPRYALTLDASNTRGYSDVIRNLQTLNAAGYKIEVFNVKRIGHQKNQDFSAVFRAMPDTIKLLNLFFDDTNTDSLVGLKGKRIESLGLWTTKNQLDENWGIDPFLLKDVEEIEFDYQNSQSGDYPRGAEVAGSIIFSRLRFDKSDTLPEIQKGLDVALIEKADQRAFQGYFGAGSWPSELDFTNHPNIKTLQGLKFGPKNDLVFKKLYLYNNSFNFNLTADQLSKSGFHHLLFRTEPSKHAEIHFSNETRVNQYQLYISGDASQMTGKWIPEFQGLLYAGQKTFIKTIYVDNQEMVNRLNDSGVPSLYGFSVVVKPAGYTGNESSADLDFSS